MALTHYIDVRLRPDAELLPAHAIAALFSRLHLYLARTQASDIAVSFPGMTRDVLGRAKQLGKALRLHGPAASLAPLAEAASWGGAASVATIGRMTAVPVDAVHQTIRRKQINSSLDRLIRRAMKRKSWTEAVAREHYADVVFRRTTLPWIVMNSASSGHSFRLFLDVSMPQAEKREGRFNTYGLSPVATVPIF